MSLEKILSVSGKPGLYRMLTQTRTGLVAESLVDGKRVSVGMRHNVSLLSEISVFTLQEEIPLREVFLKIQEKENGAAASVDPKASRDQLEEYFFSVLPNYDEERVYPSHIAKILKWYNLLLERGISDFSEPADEESESQSTADEAKPQATAPGDTTEKKEIKSGKGAKAKVKEEASPETGSLSEDDKAPVTNTAPATAGKSSAPKKKSVDSADPGKATEPKATKPAKSGKK